MTKPLAKSPCHDLVAPRLSVCICTYNRAALLEQTLATLSAQEGVAWGDIEVLVVDNNCTDSTTAITATASDTLPLRRVVEQSQGLSYARNRAVAEARGHWIIFTDDDVILDPNWLSDYVEAIKRNPGVDFVGGRITPHWISGRPRWFRGQHLDLLDGLLVWYDLGRETRTLSAADPEPFGANFGFRRSLVDTVGPFRTDLGARGDGSGRGEETEFLRRARRAGARGLYVGAAHCRHIADPRRFTLPALYRYGISKGIAHRAMTDPSVSGSSTKALLYLARGLRQLLVGRGDRFRQCVINAGIQHGFVRSRSADKERSRSYNGG